MASMPRIITVDPTWTISRIVRSAMDLLDRSIIQVDVPNANDALEELRQGCSLVVCAFELDEMKGFEFALRVKKESPETSVIILGDLDDPDELDEETSHESPFIYMSRPVDIQKFLRVMVAGMESPEAMMAALSTSATATVSAVSLDMGPIPNLDISQAQSIVDSLLTDLGAMAIIVANRAGEVILERGAVGYIDREALTTALLPIMTTNINVKDLVGGQVNTVQFYDGEDYDVFVLTIGLHHFMCVMFDGQMGSRQFGLVNRFGRRAVEDMIALLGAHAFFIQPPIKQEAPAEPRRAKPKKQVEEEPVTLEPAHIGETTPEEIEPSIQLDPIENLDADALFSMDISDMEFGDDLFDPEKLGELAKDNSGQTKAISWDDAEKLGLLKK